MSGNAAKKQQLYANQAVVDESGRLDTMAESNLASTQRAAASEESNRITNSMMISESKGRDLKIAQAKEEDCSDEL